MNLKRFENFYNNDGGFILQLIDAGVVNRSVSNSKDFIDKLNSERDSTLVDYLLPLVNDFNQHNDLDFIDFWNKKKNTYKMSNNIKKLEGEEALKKFFILSKKLKFNNIVKKDFMDAIGVPELPKLSKDTGYTMPDNSRDGSIVTGANKDNVKFVVKKITQHQNRQMY